MQLRPQLLGRRRHPSARVVADPHAGALLDEPFRDRLPHRPTAPGHDRHSARKPSIGLRHDDATHGTKKPSILLAEEKMNPEGGQPKKRRRSTYLRALRSFEPPRRTSAC